MSPVLASLVLAAAVSAQLPAPNPVPMGAPRADWTLTPGVTGTPTQRRDNPGAASQDRMYVFGGRAGNSATNVYNALYEFNGTAWTLKTAEGAVGSPPGRGGACVAWDNLRGVLVVFGGDTGGATPMLLNDTWEWNPLTNAWTDVSPVVSPSARRYAAMAFDPATGGMLMFGGHTSTVGTVPPTNETWLFANGAWNLLTPATSPPARGFHSLVTRADYGDVFLCCGGDSSTSPQTRMLDAWRWTGSDWVAYVTTTFPHGTTANQAIYDPLRKRVVVQGGQGISTPNTAGGGQYGDLYGGSPSTWCSEFDCVDGQWYLYGEAAFGTAHPVIGRISRYFGAFIPALGKIYKVSGQNPSGVGTTTGTCEYQAASVAAANPVGTACRGLSLAPAAGDRPWLTRTFTTNVTGLVPTSFVVMSYGATSLSIPLSAIHPAGVVGCDLLASLDVTLFVPNVGGMASLAVPLPGERSLINSTLRQQALQIEISGATISAISSTNALALVFGML